MRKLLLWVCLSAWGVASCQTTPAAGGTPGSASASSEPPPVRFYGPENPLPLQGYTHLVMGHCPESGQAVAMGVEAPSGEVVFRLQNDDPSLTPRLFSSAYAAGVPVTVYTAPVAVLPDEARPPPPDRPVPGDSPFFDPCTDHVPDPPPDRMDPTGGPRPPAWEQWWGTFTELGLKTAQELHEVARTPPRH